MTFLAMENRFECEREYREKYKCRQMHHHVQAPVHEPGFQFFGAETEAVEEEYDRNRIGRDSRKVQRAILHPRCGPEPGEQDHAQQCEHKTVQTSLFSSINEFTHIKINICRRK